MRSSIVMSVLAAGLGLATNPHAATLSLDAVADNTLYESPSGARSNGLGMHFFAGRTAETDSALRRGLVRFDAGANLPADAIVQSATLMLHLSVTPLGTRAVGVHRAQNAWGEGTSDAPFEEGAGTAATPGDATWIHRVRPTLLWSTPGGDFALMPSAVTDVAGVGDYVWSSPQLAADVQAWVAQPSVDFGWILIGDERVPATAKRFDSRQHPNPAVRPRLLVEFTTVADAPSPTGPTALRAHPNPFHGDVTLVIAAAPAAAARLAIFDARGRLVREVVPTGAGSWAWDGRDMRGVRAPAGVYVARLRTATTTHLQRLVRLP